MMLHAIAGLPRSGSTLLCNILAQNPAFKVSSTSPLAGLLLTMRGNLSAALEIRSELAHDRSGTETRIRKVFAAAAAAWYHDAGDKIVFDKGRGWSTALDLLPEVVPGAQAILCVRDLRAVFGSTEKQHLKFPLLDEAQGPVGWTVAGRADKLFDPQHGIIGAPLQGLIDAGARNLPYAIVWRFEDFVAAPEARLRALYDTLKLPWFDHDLLNIKNVATDLDALYLNKFPHGGSGKVGGPDANEWQQYVPAGIAAMIMEKFAAYNRDYGYA
jgi:sulfotransferase